MTTHMRCADCDALISIHREDRIHCTCGDENWPCPSQITDLTAQLCTLAFFVGLWEEESRRWSEIFDAQTLRDGGEIVSLRVENNALKAKYDVYDVEIERKNKAMRFVRDSMLERGYDPKSACVTELNRALAPDLRIEADRSRPGFKAGFVAGLAEAKEVIRRLSHISTLHRGDIQRLLDKRATLEEK
jgi:hypothetical protein